MWKVFAVLVIAAAVIALIVRVQRRNNADRTMFPGSLSNEADVFLTSCETEFNHKQKLLEDTWLADYTRYDIYADKSLLVMTKPDTKIAFDVEFVGSVRKEDQSWEWGWNNPNVHAGEAVFPESGLAEIGKKFSLPYLLEGIVPLPDDNFPVYVTSIALKVRPEALGVFVGELDDVKYFFLVAKPREYQP